MNSRSSVVELAARLVRVDSQNPPGREEAVALELADFLDRHGLTPRLERLQPGRANLLLSLGSAARPHLVFLGHADTVPVGERPWRHDPFGGEVEGGYLFGRGAADMKGAIAAMATALVELQSARLKGRVSLLVTAGEEVDGLGAEAFLRQHGVDDVDGFVIGEPTGNALAVGHKGALFTLARFFGRTAHGSMPEAGVNAVEHLLVAASHLLELAKVYGPATAAITRVAGGVQVNVIPDAAHFTVDIRSPAGEARSLWQAFEDFLRERQAADDRFAFGLEVLRERAALRTETSAPLVTAACQVLGLRQPPATIMPYFTDGSLLAAPFGIPSILYGPGEPRAAHAPDECVALDALEASVRFYRAVAEVFLGSGADGR